MKVKPENKKAVYFLGFLVVLGGYSFYSNVLSGPDSGGGSHSTPSARPTGNNADSPMVRGGAFKAKSKTNQRARAGGGDWHLIFIAKRPEDRQDPTTIDPTLRMELLAKVQSVELAGGGRNLFAFSTAPAKPVEMPKGDEPKIAMAKPAFVGPPTPPPPAQPPGPPPPPPRIPINLKYYGFASPQDGASRTAFFMDGDEILSAREGDTLKRRYRVVKLSQKDAILMDTQSQQQETVPLAPEAQQQG